jgi:acetyl-CoA carboxylase carboxyl transferase subunit beta
MAPDNKSHPEKKPGAGWLSRIAPGVRGFMRGGRKADTPSDLWVKDPDSGEMIFRAELEKSLWVTPSGRHMRINPAQRFKVTFDDGAHETLPLPTVPEDPLGFADDRPYTERLKTARDATGEPDAMAIGYGAIRGSPPSPSSRTSASWAAASAWPPARRSSPPPAPL